MIENPVAAIERALVNRRIALRRALIDCRRAHGARGLEGAVLEAQLVIDAVEGIAELELARVALLQQGIQEMPTRAKFEVICGRR